VVATGKGAIAANFALPGGRILYSAERAGLRQLGEGIGHLLAPFLSLGLLFEHGDVYAKRSIGSGHVFSRPPDTVAFKDAFVGAKHSDWLAG
jgi:hypothetical protein